ncbi:MAG: SUMF1/EgtB/PvdO family nonheme iron enzyme [Pseudomonadota bacterium]
MSGYEAIADDSPASAALVIWSPAAAVSTPILAAARAALARRVLIPVALGKSPPPPSFEHLWPMDLAGWNGRDDDPRWRFVLDEIDLAVRRGVDLTGTEAPPGVGEPAAKGPPPPDPRRSAMRRPDATSARRGSADADLEDLFAEPAMRSSAPRGRPTPKIPMAAIAAAAGVGAASVAAVVGAAYLIGRAQAPEAASRAEPVVAFVAPKALPTEDKNAPADEPPAEEPADTLVLGVPASPSDEEPDMLAVTAEPAPAATAFSEPASPEALRDAPTLLVAPIEDDSRLQPRIKPATTEEKIEHSEEAVEGDADPIAELAWTSTGDPAPEFASFGNYFRDCLDCPDMAEVESGTFMLGSPTDEPGRGAGELPAAPAAIGRRFAVAVRETTFDEWAVCVADGACAPRPDNGWGRGKRPVINVSWSDADAYAQWLSGKTGRRYRLPTETEWEYAARAGSSSAYAFGAMLAGDKANYGARRGATALTGSYAPNAFGLYDMHGNVAEWTADCWTPMLAGEPTEATAVGGFCSARVIKGGAWNDGETELRAAGRDGEPESARSSDIGFRLVRDLD